MKAEDFDRLAEDAESAVLGGARSVGILGLTPVTLGVLRRFAAFDLSSLAVVVYDDTRAGPFLPVPVVPFSSLADARHDLLVVASDEDKERLLDSAFPHVQGAPRVVVAGYGHFRFRDTVYQEEFEKLLVPSLANGYPNSLVHLYQCLVNADRLGLNGTVAEFGMFRGGTTMFLARVTKRLGRDWRVVGFDTFAGFPERRTMLDMYAHPDCVWRDVDGVRRYLDGHGVDIVQGDVVETCRKLEAEELVLSFVDTDNYSSAHAILEVIRERTLVGGAIVFDHFTGRDRFCYTLGERMAARALLSDARYFHLHDTGVFYRQR